MQRLAGTRLAGKRSVKANSLAFDQ
jgi:hypothetical protein